VNSARLSCRHRLTEVHWMRAVAAAQQLDGLASAVREEL
jgi:hypothetical protein